jgi:hypothetical protein
MSGPSAAQTTPCVIHADLSFDAFRQLRLAIAEPAAVRFRTTTVMHD